MSIRQKTPPNLIGQPSVNLDLATFEAPIWQKGYDVQIEKAVKCPCKANNGNIGTCQNCRGTGWLFINPFKTRALITSINYSTEHKDWTLDKLGTVDVTVRNQDRITYFDRITLINDYSIFSEVLTTRYDSATDTNFAFTSYKVTEIQDAFFYVSDSLPLQKLEVGVDIEIKADSQGYILQINTALPANFNSKLSVRYKHNVQYNVIDLPHEIRRSYKVNENGADQKILLPIHGVARRVHDISVFGNIPNFDGSGIIDNSYL